MKIEAPCENRIVIELSAEDMSSLNITYEEMDYSNIETRRVVWTLLDKAGHILERDIDPTGKMMIEAVPVRSGGCVLNFTLYQKSLDERIHCQRPMLKKDSCSLTYEFSGIDPAMDASQACTARGIIFSASELYESGGRYRLLLRMLSGASSAKLTLGEFGEECGEGELNAQLTREHWRQVIGESAVEKLSIQ